MTASLAALSDADLRDFCAKASPDNGRTNWNAWTREMLLAFCRNRGLDAVPQAPQLTTFNTSVSR